MTGTEPWYPSLWPAANSVGIMGLAVLVAFFLFFALGRLARGRGLSAGHSLWGAVLSTVRVSVFVIVVLTGAYLGVLASPYTGDFYRYISGAFPSFLTLLAVYLVVAALSGILRWYVAEAGAGARTRVNYVVVAFLRVFLPVGGLLTALLLGLEATGIPVGPASSWILEHGGRTALVIALALVAMLLAERAIPPMVKSSVAGGTDEPEEEAGKRADTLARTLVTAAQAASAAIAIFTIVAEVGVNIGPLLAGFGVAGIAIGFGAQSLVKDLVGGFFVIVENQYRIGDVVKLGEVAGLVEDVSLRRTLLRDLDGVLHSVPNGEVRIASNLTRGWSRVNLNLAVANKEDPDRVISLVNRVGRTLAQDPAWAPLLITAPQALGVDYFGEGSFEIKILSETKPLRQWEIMRELRGRIKKLFDQEGIEIRPSQQGLLRQMAIPRRARQAGVPRPRRREPRPGRPEAPGDAGPSTGVEV